MLATHTDAIVETLTDDHETTGAVRYEKVQAARRRLAEGRHEREELLDCVLEAILNDVKS